MKKHAFDLGTEEDLILLPAFINDYGVKLALDTAATQTIVDFNVLLMLGYATTDIVSTDTLETASGTLEAHKFHLLTFETLDYHRVDFFVYSYDFLQQGILSAYDGVLGLDFFRGRGQLTIDFKEQVLWFLE